MRYLLIGLLLIISPSVNAMALDEYAIRIISEGKVLGSQYPISDSYVFRVTLEHSGKIYDCTIVPKGAYCMEIGQYYLKN